MLPNRWYSAKTQLTNQSMKVGPKVHYSCREASKILCKLSAAIARSGISLGPAESDEVNKSVPHTLSVYQTAQARPDQVVHRAYESEFQIPPTRVCP